MDEFKIQPDEKELRMERRRREGEEFTKRLELEKAKRDLRRRLKVGTHMLRATAEMLDAMVLDDFDGMMEDRDLMGKVMDLFDNAVRIQEVLGSERL